MSYSNAFVGGPTSCTFVAHANMDNTVIEWIRQPCGDNASASEMEGVAITENQGWGYEPLLTTSTTPHGACKVPLVNKSINFLMEMEDNAALNLNLPPKSVAYMDVSTQRISQHLGSKPPPPPSNPNSLYNNAKDIGMWEPWKGECKPPSNVLLHGKTPNCATMLPHGGMQWI